MCNEYKVIQEFCNLKKGDMLVYNPDADLYVCDIERNGVKTTVWLNNSAVDEKYDDGFLAVTPAQDDNDELQKTIDNTLERIDDLINQYGEDNKIINDKYNNQEVPTCVKLEADTVHYNLIKVLKEIKGLLNE